MLLFFKDKAWSEICLRYRCNTGEIKICYKHPHRVHQREEDAKSILYPLLHPPSG